MNDEEANSYTRVAIVVTVLLSWGVGEVTHQFGWGLITAGLSFAVLAFVGRWMARKGL